MIKAIVFDCFGVLVNDGWLPFKRKYFADNHTRFVEATDLNKAVDAGYLDYDTFISGVSELAGISTQQTRTEIEQNPADHKLFTYIASTLKPTYKIGLLSNAGANWLSDLFSPDQVAIFDATALSYEMGTVKPDPRCYETIASRLDVLPEECVFIDDQERYCTGASEAGMQSIHFTNTEDLIQCLEMVLQSAN